MTGRQKGLKPYHGVLLLVLAAAAWCCRKLSAFNVLAGDILGSIFKKAAKIIRTYIKFSSNCIQREDSGCSG